VYDIADFETVIFDVDNITPVVWPEVTDDPMKHLVLPKRDKDIVQALSKKFEKRNESTWSADFIEDKGAGQVFLLHGQSLYDTNRYTAKKLKAEQLQQDLRGRVRHIPLVRTLSSSCGYRLTKIRMRCQICPTSITATHSGRYRNLRIVYSGEIREMVRSWGELGSHIAHR
jgi:hypothetical protein